MIRTEIWKGGSNTVLDSLFHELREQNYLDRSHPLYQNYTDRNFTFCERLSITFDNDKPVCCSSIMKRSCWPQGAYRILNRFWKVASERIDMLNTDTKMLRVTDNIKAQQEYAIKHLNAKLVFISRQEDNWQEFLIKSIKKNTGYDWCLDKSNLYQTFEVVDDSCWQRIIYFGDKNLLTSWNKK